MTNDQKYQLIEKPMSDEDRRIFRVKAEHVAGSGQVLGAESQYTKGEIDHLERMVDHFHDQAWRDGRRAGMIQSLRHSYPDVPADALDSALVGEAEPMSKYGINQKQQAEQSLDESHRIASRQASASAVELDATAWEPINSDRPVSFTDGTIAHLLDLLGALDDTPRRGSRPWEDAAQRVADWALVVAQEHYDRGVNAARNRADPVLKPSIEEEANGYLVGAEQRTTFAEVLDRAINLAKGGYNAFAEQDGLKKLHEFDAAILAKRAFKAGFKRGVNAVYDDAESGIDRPGFAVWCRNCQALNHYPGGFPPDECGNCGRDLSADPRYREVDRVEDVPVFEPIARASHHDAAFSAATGEYALIKLYCQPHQAEKVYAAALELVDREGEAVSGPWYGPGVAKERSEDLFGDAREAAEARLMETLETAEAEATAKRERQHKEELNAAYSDGYRTGKMHAGRAARFLAGEDLEEPDAETPLVYVTVSRKGKITASGPAPAVLEVLRGVLELEDEDEDEEPMADMARAFFETKPSRAGGARIRSSLWGIPVVETDEVPEGVIVVEQPETPASQAIRQAVRDAERRFLSEARDDIATQRE